LKITREQLYLFSETDIIGGSMIKDKVIRMNRNNDNMGQRIHQAAQDAEQRYQEKLQRSRESDVDVRDFFDDEELDQILQGNEFFTGKIADFTKMQRYNKMKMAAKWLDAHCWEIAKTEIDTPSKTRPNVTISIEVRRLSSLKGQEKQVFAAMQILADSVFMSGLKDEVIRFTFGIEGVWN